MIRIIVFLRRNYLPLITSSALALLIFGVWFAYGQQYGIMPIGTNLSFKGDLMIAGDLEIAGNMKGYAVPTHMKSTTATRNGNFGNYQGMYNWIQVNGCEGYHVCDISEIVRYQKKNGPVQLPHSWYLTGAAAMTSVASHECNGWTSAGADYGPITSWVTGGWTHYTWGVCSTVRNVACCKY